jgi:hypothetical protein
MNEDNSLLIFTEGARLLAEASTIQKVKELKNLALTAADWARRWNKGKEAVAFCRSYAFDAERKMGEMIKHTPLDHGHSGGRPRKDGKKPNASCASGFQDRPTLAELGIEPHESVQAQRLAEMPLEVFERIKSGEISRYKAAHVAHNSGEYEWYTPSEYIDAVREAMGSIDCDPASSALANETVQATEFFTETDNGLAQQWRPNVFLNPPYAQPLIGHFVEALFKVESGEVEQACVLVNNATETGWFTRIVEHASAICFPAARIKFLDPNGNHGTPLQGQAIIYLGKNREAFAKALSGFGFICYVIHQHS